jgi:hypothetical protein
MLAGFAVRCSSCVVLLVLDPTAPLTLGCYHCVTTGILLHSVALRMVQCDTFFAPVRAANDVIHNQPQQQKGPDCKDEKKLKLRRFLERDGGFRARYPSETIDVFLLIASRRGLGPKLISALCILAVFVRTHWPSCEYDRPTSFSTEFRNTWSCTFTPLHCVACRDNFTFAFITRP